MVGISIFKLGIILVISMVETYLGRGTSVRSLIARLNNLSPSPSIYIYR